MPQWSRNSPEPEPPRRRLAVVVLLSVLVLLVVGGAGAAYYLRNRDGGDTLPTAGTVTGTPEPTGSAGPDAQDGTPAPESSSDARFVEVGQCVRNDGEAGDKPRLTITDCAPQTYEVLRRVDGATTGKSDALAKCAKVEGYTDWYFFDSELDTLDFVLCLKQR
ncbi:hypothetical protein [Plantactinospora sp. KBS50]|uniref:LppU/SCO3897 family protein n=1 Tax=Plantactinospora sp. KBS50 TaxID=2024580 RepID=UPI000BAAE7B7|nr:hypothetical protein [Plantactinospora sp. KBS50]ASW58102.1 hypothetical protein CIK06_28730 [Plantactinospora sp. KBS50]